MEVHVAGLHSGANTSYDAADHADGAAATLSRTTPDSGMFGDFAAAHSFHQSLEAAHTRHVELIKKHTANLGTIGDKAHKAAAAFAEMDQDNAEKLKDVY
ncbi:DUF2563 family protein [Mycolicibacterium komossense]|uniref:DUF2563 family protein n=1 Tax=Mycolicibacterium komossense TaxID=1779 RepID=A0ABT3CL46_9MYCO|nr:DUF2563 family protein [Mycolicibacterium komossense]MCV7230235.1 DUF2563 family protein [Mycolicibacterium komossense]